jgi:Ca2+/H+ antiporter
MSGGGVGWQAWFGGLLAVIGGVSVVQPQVGGLLLPVALVVLGLVLVFGGLRFDSGRFR